MLLDLDRYFWCDDSLILNPTPTLVEIGTFSLHRSLAFLKQYPTGNVRLVEADPLNFDRLTAKPLPPQVIAYNCALANVDGPATIMQFGNNPLSSSLFPRHLTDGRKMTGAATVPGFTLKSLLDRLGVETVDLLLLNCEGGELFAFDSLLADSVLAGRIHNICFSFHCKHCRIYSPVKQVEYLERLGYLYTVNSRPIPTSPEYFLLTPKTATGTAYGHAGAVPTPSLV